MVGCRLSGVILLSLIDALKHELSIPRDDKALHFSQHLQHDRHTVLYWSEGYPHVVPSWGRMFPLIQGTGVHETIHTTMSKLYPKYVPEHEIIGIDDALRYPWKGSADAYVEMNDQVWLLDYKTISGAGMSFLNGQPKPEHILQVSAYYHFGPVQTCKAAVVYFPSSPNYAKSWDEPVMLEFEPIPKNELLGRMVEVERLISDYLEEGVLPDPPASSYTWKKYGKAQTWRLEERPHYTSMFCPWASFTDDPCGCSNATTRTIGTYKKGTLKSEPGCDIMVKEIVDDIGVPDED